MVSPQKHHESERKLREKSTKRTSEEGIPVIEEKLPMSTARLEKIRLAERRGYATHFEWPDKPLKERGTTLEILDFAA